MSNIENIIETIKVSKCIFDKDIEVSLPEEIEIPKKLPSDNLETYILMKTIEKLNLRIKQLENRI